MNSHRLAARVADGVCTRALARGFCPAAARFARYTTAPPKLGLAIPAKVRAPQRVTIALATSKQTSAHLVVRDRTGRLVLDRRLALGRFGSRIVLPIRRAGHYSFTLAATAINGRRATTTRTLTATPPPKPKPKPKKAKKAKTKPKAAKLAERAADQGSAKRTKPGS
jgi:hypothetical protein